MPAHAVGNPGRPGEPTVAPPRPFRRSQLCTLCWPALLRRPLAVRSRLGPNVDGVAGRIQRSELLPSRDAPAGLSTVHEGHPVRGGGCLRDGRQRWGSVHSGDEGPAGFRRAACAHTGAVHGACGSGSPTRSAGVSMGR